MSIFATFNLARQGMQTNQYGINVVSNNISNMNNANYSKQRLEFSSVRAYNSLYTTSGWSYIGAGAQIDALTRQRSAFLDNYFREQVSDLSYTGQMASYASSIEKTLSDLENKGLNDAFTTFYNAAQTLKNNPTNMTLRTNYLEQAQNLCDKFNSVAKTLNDTRVSLVGDISDFSSIFNSKTALTANEVNSKLEQIRDLNDKILKLSTGGIPPNDILDLRDKLVDELSSIIPVDTKENSNGTINISFNKTALVTGNEQKAKFDVTAGDVDNPVTIRLTDMEGNVLPGKENINSSITSGEIAAYLDICGVKPNSFSIPNILSGLDKLAQEFANTVNDIQTFYDTANNVRAMALDANGKLTPAGAADYIFVDKTGGVANITASSISINADVMNDPKKLATARVETDAAGLPLDPDAVGNGDNIGLVSELKNTKIAGLGQSTANNYLINTLNDFYGKISSINSKYEAQNTVVGNIETQRQSIMGVNIDEEIIDLIKYQKAYESAARVFNTANEIMTVLVNLGR